MIAFGGKADIIFDGRDRMVGADLNQGVGVIANTPISRLRYG